ncbi:MAG: type III secretion system cytoplasmic ring protein SctQ [Desulfovibrio sp.]|jgi:type III secretion system YscQ/HrcQ family protein|nr:type III secretion system cytoplasmic ring protein SctQ [Desulfovibrio sp.]
MSVTPECRPLPFLRISSAFAALLNQWHRAGGCLAFHAAGGSWELTPDAGISPVFWRIRIYARLGDCEVAVLLDNTVPADWKDSGLDARALFALPPELAGPALELSGLELAETLETACGLPVSVIGCNLEPEKAWLPEEGLLFSLCRKETGTVVRTNGAFVADIRCLEKIVRLFSQAALRSPSALNESLLQNFPLQARIILPGPELSSETIRALEAGDIVLTNAPSALPEQRGIPVRLNLTDSFGASAYLAGAALHMESAMAADATPTATPATIDAPDSTGGEQQTMPDGADNIEDRGRPPLDPKDIPLRLSFDLGSAELSMAEVASLAPGQVLETGRNITNPVRVFASGRLIGTGSLMDVSGQVGVRIETLRLP